MLINKKDFKDRILNISKWKESFYKKYINNKIKIEKLLKEKTFKEKSKFNFLRDSILKKYNCNFIDINNENNNVKVRELSKKCFDINRMIANEARLKTSVYNKNNIFNWPVNNVRWISAYFKDTEYIKDFWTNHDAIDIVVSQWTDIKPVSAWYVIAIKKPTGDNYSYIAIKHKNGYISVYGHLSKVYVDKFDYVDYNDIIAQSWGEFWTPWAGFLTTWPHLHLEIFKEKSYIDPLTHLDITNLNYNSLPKKYHDKYYIDFKNKNWYEYINKSKKSFVFRIKGTNEIERQKYLLNTYASSDFKNWQIWIDESLEENIDPSFVMCLWLAETSLWRYLKTPYNIWNVWNTDSWATKYFKNPRSGIYWVAKTLNNRYLKRYNSLNMLSRYWNKDLTKPIYASSDTHWHKNIKRCLSHIKWTFIDDNYNFRLK
jgi:murein DD-endopeptidase MepM/ murein hydrolase activator NlpD